MATTCKAITGKGISCGCKTNFEVCGKHNNWSECPICYSYYGKSKMTTLECGHTFCKECIENWFCESSDVFDSCPLCRKESLKVLSLEHVDKKIQKCFREFGVSNELQDKVYSLEKQCMYLNTRHGKDFLRTHEFYRKTFVKIISRTSREYSKNIKKAYKNCLAIEREYNKQMKKSKMLSGWGMFLKIKHGEMKTDRDMVGNHRRIAEMWMDQLMEKVRCDL